WASSACRAGGACSPGATRRPPAPPLATRAGTCSILSTAGSAARRPSPTCGGRWMRSSDSEPSAALADLAERADAALAEVERAVVGRREALELVLLGLLADGHVLIEDLPGL